MYFPALDPTSNHLLDLSVREWAGSIGTNKTEFNRSEKAAGILNIKASTGLVYEKRGRGQSSPWIVTTKRDFAALLLDFLNVFIRDEYQGTLTEYMNAKVHFDRITTHGHDFLCRNRQ